MTPKDTLAVASESRSPRWFWPALLLICLVGAAIRFLIRSEYMSGNPLAGQPIIDADTYWQWAGRIAAGELTSKYPFFSAPLYPYLLGLLRAVGGGLGAVYAIQIAIDLLTACTLALIARRRFGADAGLGAAALFLLLFEPASYSLRVLTGSIQLLLVAALWLLLLRARRKPTLPAWIGAGSLLGLNCLANPPMMLAVPILSIWPWWLSRFRTRGLLSSALVLASAMLVISPATWHNYRASGELIPISAQAGVTFAHGNSAAATGTYTPIEGVSTVRRQQNLDALRYCERVTGKTATWNDVNRFYFSLGLDHWRETPRHAVGLALRKAWWFVSGRNYGDIYQPAIERQERITPLFWLTPLPTAWLVPPALLTLILWLRRPSEFVPELVLFAVPLLVVTVFWYSPRYRLPAIPVMVIAAAWLVWQAAHAKAHRRWIVASALALLIGVGTGLVNRQVGFDTIDELLPQFYCALGDAADHSGDSDQAARYFRSALEFKPDYAPAAANLGLLLSERGSPGEGLAYLRAALRAEPENAGYHDRLGMALAKAGNIPEALASFRQAVMISPQNPQYLNNLGNALAETQQWQQAITRFQEAIRIEPTFAEAYANLGRAYANTGDFQQGLHYLNESLRLDPNLEAARQMIQQIQRLQRRRSP